MLASAVRGKAINELVDCRVNAGDPATLLTGSLFLVQAEWNLVPLLLGVPRIAEAAS
jgi:hypothetical protein